MVRKATTFKPKVVEMPATDLGALVDDYLADKRAQGLSRRSVDLIKSTLDKTFMRWATKHEVTALTQETLNAWSRYLLDDHRTPDDKPLSRASIRTYQRTARSFIKWAQERGDVDAKVKMPMAKDEHRIREVLDRDEILSMESAASSERDKLIIRLLGDTGMRLGELLGLTADDLTKQGDGRYVKVHGKGARDRMVPLGPAMFTRLEKYARRPQAKQSESKRIFTTERKRNGGYMALSGRAVEQMVKAVADEAGITKRVHPHGFRHAAITHMINRSMPLEHIRRIVGHADLSLISSTYSHVDAGDLHRSFIALIRDDQDDRRRR
jgi:site-specific recombinase XerD